MSLTPGIFGNDFAISHKWVTDPLGVNSFDLELVAVSLLQSRHVNLQILGGAYLLPGILGGVILLHSVVFDGAATVVLGSVPQERAAVTVHIHHVQWTLRSAWPICNTQPIDCCTDYQLNFHNAVESLIFMGDQFLLVLWVPLT